MVINGIIFRFSLAKITKISLFKRLSFLPDNHYADISSEEFLFQQTLLQRWNTIRKA